MVLQKDRNRPMDYKELSKMQLHKTGEHVPNLDQTLHLPSLSLPIDLPIIKESSHQIHTTAWQAVPKERTLHPPYYLIYYLYSLCPLTNRLLIKLRAINCQLWKNLWMILSLLHFIVIKASYLILYLERIRNIGYQVPTLYLRCFLYLTCFPLCLTYYYIGN